MSGPIDRETRIYKNHKLGEHHEVHIEPHMKGLRVKHVQTPTGVVALLRPVAEKLLAEGIISGSLDGELHAADAMTVKAAVLAGRGVCDFCSAPGPSRDFNVPDFDMTDGDFDEVGLESTGGWAACDTCAALIDADKRKDLLKRSIETAAFPKFTHDALKQLHGRFWRAMDSMVDVSATAKAITDTINGTIPDEIDREFPTPLPRIPIDFRKAAVKRELSFTDEEVELLLKGQVSTSMARRMLAWKKAGKSALLPQFAKPTPPTPPDLIPHWQKALDAKFEAYVALKKMIEVADTSEFPNDPHALRKAQRRRELREMGFMDDVKALRDAQTYSFNADTIAAIREASQYVPLDTPLTAVEFPQDGAGWFYFAEPLPINASPLASDKVHALLWTWESQNAYEVQITDAMMAKLLPADRERLEQMGRMPNEPMLWTEHTVKYLAGMLKRAGIYNEAKFNEISQKVEVDPAIVFSAYVRDERGQFLKKGSIAPSTRFFWRYSNTLAECLERNGRSWDVTYGPESEHKGEPYVMGRVETLKAVEQLARFFATACSWFKQKVPVLTREPAHIERHERKRLMKDHKLPEPPKVNIVALRRSERVAREDAPADRQAGAREYSCRWIVRRHARLQPYGPGRSQKKLIWIEAHPAGPDDKPLRTRETVYAVIR